MKGITYITDSKNKRKAVVIDYALFKNHEEEIEDLLDIIIAESRRKEQSIPYEKVLKSIRQKRTG